jgi:uncharacterized protein (DUF4213/DUF364 family)
MRNLFELYDKLIELASSDEKIDFAGSFPDWAVVGVGGSLGLSMNTEGKSREPLTSLLNNPLGMKICDAAPAIKSWNFEEASLALAAVNAVLNTKERLSALGCYEPYKNYSTRGLDLKGKTVGLVGHLKFPVEKQDEVKKIYTFERNPQEGDYPDTAEEYILPSCDIVLISGSTLVNKTLPRLLELTKNAHTILIGPSVPMTPELLDFGIDTLAGLVITNTEGLKEASCERIGKPYGFGLPFLIRKEDFR